ncbi:MAG: molybdate ABC transporter substrate-binding protein [Pseudomonadota bacterium]
MLCVLVLFINVNGTARAESLLVFAAASMSDAMQDLAESFEAETGTEVVLSLAASSVLAKQIEHGAPAGIFISANPAWMDYLDAQDLIVSDSRRDIAANRLALITPAQSNATVDLAIPDTLVAALGPDGRLAVGDPAHVPAGDYARQALEALVLWDVLEPRLARAANVRAALALVERGESPLGIAYATDTAVSERVKIVAIFPRASHTPIVYPGALITAGDQPAAQAFLDFIVSPKGAAILAEHGFLPP